MTKAEIEAALQAAFYECMAANCPLTEQQKRLLLEVVEDLITAPIPGISNSHSDGTNPLNDLALSERQALLEFVKEKGRENQAWKFQLLNDWLNNRHSGSVQFIRDRYGIGWLNSIKPIHLAEYFDCLHNEILNLKVGDRIEVSNSLWEWVQENGPCGQEWFPCTVILVNDKKDCEPATCIIRFDNGREYEIQGIYDWNRYNWRWLA